MVSVTPKRILSISVSVVVQTCCALNELHCLRNSVAFSSILYDQVDMVAGDGIRQYRQLESLPGLLQPRQPCEPVTSAA